METSFNACVDGFSDKSEKERFERALPKVLWHEAEYMEHASQFKLFQIKSLVPSEWEIKQEIVGDLTKDQLMNLYSYNMVKRSPGRNVYDKIMASANEKCPYCGGIGVPKNLDHYMPKSHFPQFSVLPSNLIPSCRDCNMEGKGSSFASSAAEQIIHPYIDDECFFQEQWITAEYEAGNPGAVKYSVSPPAHWSKINAQRAIKHFQDFDIARRYSIEAGRHLGELLPQCIATLQRNGAEEMKECLLYPVIKALQFPNHWKRVMYQAIALNADSLTF